MKLFVALRIPSPVAADLGTALAHGPGAPHEAEPAPRWVTADRLHVTLAFLGQVPQEGQEELRTRLARTAARHAPLSLRIRGTGRFGDRVLFARLAGDLEGLHRLAASVQAAVLRTSPRQEERPWRPHVTLARCAAGESGDSLRALVEQLAGYEGPEWTAERIHLVSSVPPCGPRRPPHYVDVVTWPLSRC